MWAKYPDQLVELYVAGVYVFWPEPDVPDDPELPDVPDCPEAGAGCKLLTPFPGDGVEAGAGVGVGFATGAGVGVGLVVCGTVATVCGFETATGLGVVVGVTLV